MGRATAASGLADVQCGTHHMHAGVAGSEVPCDELRTGFDSGGLMPQLRGSQSGSTSSVGRRPISKAPATTPSIR